MIFEIPGQKKKKRTKKEKVSERLAFVSFTDAQMLCFLTDITLHRDYSKIIQSLLRDYFIKDTLMQIGKSFNIFVFL